MARNKTKFWSYVWIVVIIFIIPLLVAIWGSVAHGQEPTVTITDFSGGLNTKTNPFLLKPNEFVQLHNWLLSEEFGSLVLRHGDLARTDSLNDSIPETIEWRCIVLDTATTTGLFNLAFVKFRCDSDLPVQDGFLDGISVDSLFGTRPPPGGDSGFAFTIKEYIKSGSPNDSEGIFYADSGSVSEDIGDSIKFEIDSASFRQANDTGGVTGLYAFYSKPTTKMLMYIIPGFGSRNQWSSLYASKSRKYEPTKKLADFIYKGETPLWETWNGKVFIALPRQRPLITNGTRTGHLVPRAPGQIEIVPAQPSSSNPADDTAWTIDGTVRYSLLRRNADTTGGGATALMDRIGYVSHEVPVFNEWNVLFGFPPETGDSLHNAVISDSVLLYIVRTRGNPDASPQFADSFFIIDSIISGSPSILDTLTMIDSIPNDSLGTSDWTFVGLPKGLIPYDSGYVDSATDIFDLEGPATGPNRSQFFTAPGQPTLVKQEHTARADDWWPDGAESDTGNLDHIGWAYAVTKFDTLFNIMSDTSPNLIVSTSYQVDFNGGKDSTSVIAINIPPLTQFDTGLVRMVWRAQIKNQQIGDSVIVSTDTFIVISPGEVFDINGTVLNRTIIRTFSSPVKHVIRSALLPVGILQGNEDTLFLDSMNWSTWHSGGARSVSIDLDRRFSAIENKIDIAKGFFAFKDNLFAWSDSRLFRSTLDNPTFQVFNDILFDPENGDVITQVTNIGPNLIVFWSDGLTELYDPLATLPTKGSPVSGFGCFAPQSLINYGGSVYFMAKDGIRTITSHQVKKFGVGNRIISQKINDQIVDSRSDSVKSTMAAGIGPDGQTLIFSYPSVEIMFIYDPRLDAWTTRDGSFFQATNYDTTSVEGLLKSSSMVYAKTGDERVFDLHASPTFYDSGLTSGAFVGVFETAPLLADPNEWQIVEIGVMKGSSNKNGTFNILDESGTNVANKTFPSTDPIYTIKSMPINQGIFLSLLYGTSSIQITLPDTLRRIDIWARPLGRPIVK